MEKNNYYGIDLVGQRHERLLVIHKSDNGRTRWVCKCDCGNEVELTPYYFFQYKSCGCLEKENKQNLTQYTKTHGMTKSILYHKYCDIKERCFNHNYRYYHRYGGRGITICDEWMGKHGFENFMKWAYDNGYDDNKKTYEQTLDRIDVDGNYCPSNCRWVDQMTQSNNRSTNVFIEDAGEKLTLSQFARKHGINKGWFVRRRFKKGYSASEILSEWKGRNETI